MSNLPNKFTLSLIIQEVVAFTLIVFAAIIFLSLFSFSPCDSNWLTSTGETPVDNYIGKIGAEISHLLLFILGYLSWWVALSFLFLGIMKLRIGINPEYAESLTQKFHANLSTTLTFRILTFLFAGLMLAGLFSLHVEANTEIHAESSGGLFGLWLSEAFREQLNDMGATIVLYLLFFVFLILSFAVPLSSIATSIGEKVIAALLFIYNHYFAEKTLANDPRSPTMHYKKQVEPFDYVSVMPERNTSQPAQSIEISKAKEEHKEETPSMLITQEFISADKGKSQFLLPPIDLLDSPSPTKAKLDDEILVGIARLVETKLLEFGVEARVVGLQNGPVITLFELEPGSGVKVSKISGLERDLARSLSVSSVRVIEVIPGKSVIGLEVPNSIRATLSLSEILNSESFNNSSAKLPLALGVDISGVVQTIDLATMPHLLVAGTTGSGKSVGINGMLLSLLFRRTSAELKLILVDPKRIELGCYDGISHLLTPVITDTKQVLQALKWCTAEMENRYQLMEKQRAKNLESYNDRLKILNDDSLQPFPYIVLVIDEFADMMHQVGKQAETEIVSLAQKARACGIHLILATQRPTVDVITGLIKSNIPARVSYQVGSKLDSRTILEQSGAEQLLGRGDLLFVSSGGMQAKRYHGPYVSETEVDKVVHYLKSLTSSHSSDGNQKESDIINLSEHSTESKERAEAALNPEDQELYNRALEIIKATKRVSVSYLQRRLKLGYNHAARIVDEMEKNGIVSPLSSNGKREYLGD